MNKCTKSNVKKTLVRNTRLPVQKCKVIIADPQTNLKTGNADFQADRNKSETKTQATTSSEHTAKESKLFSTPELHSSAPPFEKIDEIVKTRKTKSCSDADKKKLALDEKVSRKVNFPYDRPIYKDLIPLSSYETSCQVLSASRDPLPQKDKEPVLSDFIKPRIIPEYYHLPIVKIDHNIPSVCSDNLRLYKSLEKYKL